MKVMIMVLFVLLIKASKTEFFLLRLLKGLSSKYAYRYFTIGNMMKIIILYPSLER